MRSRNITEGFRFASSGLWYVLSTQRNARIHLPIGAGVVLLGLWLRLSFTQWAVLVLTISFVLVSEMVNTVSETLVDLACPEYHPLAKVVKDVTAGAVLLAAITSVVVGLLVLGPPLWERLFLD
jgi:diacylglycerol kinase